MPKLYEYFGLVLLFYSNEHEPIHVHGRYQEMECKADLIIDDGEIVDIRYSTPRGRRTLGPAQSRDFKAVVERHAEEIVDKWKTTSCTTSQYLQRRSRGEFGDKTKQRRNWHSRREARRRIQVAFEI
ncbi:MAG: DUF4160 domain-containing protein [bacterium]|nr:DUF4160 domain-containing protein [bacterium]